ncbi:hypothetical protein [Bradyrhizobium sp. Tv2a-2]|uniref:hypothetical protein n=1 Tax=Bradyrhizobium sp. Tv2a-2 TaxID=113395 RepID=UPI0003F866BE|nr:hypothetical protein [Bradyrhizobium sp. Tv2a-2]
MSIPSNIINELTSLQKQVVAAKPLQQASRATIVALQLNAAQLVSDIETALTAPNNLLDTWSASIDPGAIVSGLLSVVSTAQDQSTLSFMRGVTGRAASNLNQLT